MRTVSLEMARKLKEAGLEWDWEIGDWYCVYDVVTGNVVKVYLADENFSLGNYLPEHFTRVWLPTLSDLLEWLEGRGYGWELYHTGAIKIFQPGLIEWFNGKSIEDAAAKAVLWVLEQEATNMGRR